MKGFNVPLCAVLSATIATACTSETQLEKSGEWMPPLPSTVEVGPPPEFTGRVPVLGGGDAPADTLELTRIIGGDDTFGYIAAMEITPQGLFVADLAMSPHLALVDIETGEIRNRFGSNGFGPGEFRAPNWITPHPGEPSLYWVFDPSTHRFALVRPDAPGKSATVMEMTLEVGLPIDRPVWIGDQLVSGGLFADFTLLRMDRRGRPISQVAVSPPFTPNEIQHYTGRSLLNRTFMAPSPGRDRIVLAYQSTNRLDFFTANSGHYGTVAGPRKTTARFRIRDDRFFWEADHELAYWSVAATDRYVYALFCGCTFEENGPPKLLHVFTWSGDFVTEIALREPMYTFTVTQDDKVIYGAIQDPFPRIAEWTLPEWLWLDPVARQETDQVAYPDEEKPVQ